MNNKRLNSDASTMDLEMRASDLIADTGCSLGDKIIKSDCLTGIVPSEFYTYLDYLVDKERVDVVIKLINRLTTERILYYHSDTKDLKDFLQKNQDKSLLLRMLLRHIHYREDNLSVMTRVRFTYREFITGEQFLVDGTTRMFPRTIVHYLRGEPLASVEPAFFCDLNEAIQLAYVNAEPEDRLAKYAAVFRAILPELVLVVTNEHEFSRRLDKALSYLTGLIRSGDHDFRAYYVDDVLDKDIYQDYIAIFLRKLTPAQLLTLQDTALEYILAALNDGSGHKTAYATDGEAAEKFRNILRSTPAFEIAHEAYQVDAQIRINTPIYLRSLLKLNDPEYFRPYILRRQFKENDSED